jgi:hypothetical protein
MHTHVGLNIDHWLCQPIDFALLQSHARGGRVVHTCLYQPHGGYRVRLNTANLNMRRLIQGTFEVDVYDKLYYVAL